MSAVRAVHQFHSGVSPGDAITSQMLRLQMRLRAMGFRSDVFGHHIGAGIEDRVRPLPELQLGPDDLLLYHHSMGADSFEAIVAQPCRLAVVYHNITPERFFADEGWRRYVRLGHEQLAVLAGRCAAAVADSNFNRLELLRQGFRDVQVLPVRTDFAEFVAARAEGPRTGDWLFVGRIVANKAQLELVRAFAAHARAFGGRARLLLVGDVSQADYVDAVRREASRLGVGGRVLMPGKLPDADIVTAYATAGVFVCLSEHEGFGVPVLEAMAAGIPVVAHAAAAVPETMGGAGVLLRERTPALVAATVEALRRDERATAELVARQHLRVARLQEFDTDAVLRRVVEVAGGRPRRRTLQIQGPFETSYSLAVLNRRLGETLAARGPHRVSLYPTEGPGDYTPDPADLARHPVAAALAARAVADPYPDVVIRQMYPPRAFDSPGGATLQYFGWEESRLPQAIVDEFNGHLTGVGAMSGWVRQLLRDSGVEVPIAVVGVGVDAPAPDGHLDAPEVRDLRATRFLHISSAFPRKGVDVLLAAWFEAFSGADDVTLVLKTFPNPHNDVGRLLAELRSAHPDPPDVRWIDRDLSRPELDGLYALATCLVHPARGEGFGLPVAEAMAAGVPVIAPAHTGLAEFVSEETALVIGHRVEPARTHLSVPGSMWAEPDRADLVAALRSVAADPGSDALRARAERGRQVVAERCSWDAVAARWEDLVELSRWAVRTPRVDMVSTWNSRCGIAENTRYIVGALGERADVAVHADRGAVVLDPARERGVTRHWVGVVEPELDALEAELLASERDVVHVQFNFGFFELRRLAALLGRLRAARAVVVSLHRTADIEVHGAPARLADIAGTLRELDQVIVHQPADAAALAAIGVEGNVRVVPLGVPPAPATTSAQARAALGLAGRPVLATFGFLLPHKGLLELLEVVADLRRRHPDLVLLAACALHPDPSSAAFEAEVRHRTTELGLDPSVRLITDFLPDQVAQGLLAAADAVVLPYRATGESSSAALRFVLPVGRPVVASDLPIFDDAREALVLVPPGDRHRLVDELDRLLGDPEAAARQRDLVATAAARLSWGAIAADHLEVYAEALRRAAQRGAVR